MKKRYAASRRGVLKYVLLLALLIPVGTLAFAGVPLYKEPGALLSLLLPVGLIEWAYVDRRGC